MKLHPPFQCVTLYVFLTNDWPTDVPQTLIFFVPRCQLSSKPPRLSKKLWFQSDAIPNSHNSISSQRVAALLLSQTLIATAEVSGVEGLGVGVSSERNEDSSWGTSGEMENVKCHHRASCPYCRCYRDLDSAQRVLWSVEFLRIPCVFAEMCGCEIPRGES